MDNIEPKISIKYKQDVIIATLTAEKILEDGDIKGIEQSVFPLITGETGIKMVLDFSNVQFLTSAFLGLLIRISKKIAESDGKLKLCCIKPKIQDIFRITRLDKVFEIYLDQDAALKTF